MILFLHFDYLRNHLIQYFKIVLESFAAASGIVDHDTFGPEPSQGKAHGHAVIIVGRYGAGVMLSCVSSQWMPMRVSSVQMAWIRSLSWKRM